MNKVYAVIEKYTENVEREENVFDKWILSIHNTKEGAVSAVGKRHDDIIEEIIDGDENEMSRISADDKITIGGEVVGCSILNDTCSEWELRIVEKELKD